MSALRYYSMFFSLLLEPICPATCKKKKAWNHPWSHKAPTTVLNCRLLTNIWRKEEWMKAWGYDSKQMWEEYRTKRGTVNRESRSHGRTEWTYQLFSRSSVKCGGTYMMSEKKKSLVISQNAFLFCWPSLSMYMYAQVSIKWFDNINPIQ